MITLEQQRICQVIQSPRMEYVAAWEWQRELVKQRSAGEIGDTLLLIEHPHTYTLGRAAKDEGHLLVGHDTLAEQGIALVASDRGGDITYHGPGQIVGYPILKLSRYGGDVLRYLRMLEETLMQVLATYGVATHRIEDLTGVWVNNAKIAAIGVKLSASGVTHHGFALNVDTDLRYFQQIIPCGIADKGVTSLQQQRDLLPPRAEIEQRIIETFGRLFAVEMRTT